MIGVFKLLESSAATHHRLFERPKDASALVDLSWRYA